MKIPFIPGQETLGKSCLPRTANTSKTKPPAYSTAESTISTDGLNKLAKRTGNEPIIIVEVDWGQGPIAYADRDLPGIHGRILQVGELDNVVDVSGSNSSQELSVVLDDTDGSIKAIFDTQDVHQRPARVYQWFEGLDIADKFLLFAGKVSSPIVWSEADRTFSFSIISQLEDKEIGFSAEEGQFPYLPKDLVGKPWPMIFGKVLDVPALQVNKAVSGTTLCGVGILSGAALHNAAPLGGENCGLGMSLASMQAQVSVLQNASTAWAGIDDVQAAQYLQQANGVLQQMGSAIAGSQQQKTCAVNARKAKVQNKGLGCNPVRILGGEDFPRGTIKLNINGGLFTGQMHNDSFTISNRQHPDNDAKAQDAFDSLSECPPVPTPPQMFDFAAPVPPGRGDLGGSVIRNYGFIICDIPATSRPSVNQIAQHFWAEPGSRVVMASDEPITYIVSITPGTVLAVKAYKQFQSQSKLVNVPNSLWRVETVSYGPITAIQVVVKKPLSTIVDQGWSDDLYVTFQSTIGPNVVDILKYLIDTYTDLDWDASTFNAVAVKLAPFPANFPILDRKNTIEVLRDIAFQARCAIWISNGTFFLKYLPEEPTADATIAVSDVASGTLQLETTPTEDVVTKLVATWRLSWANDPEKIILRHNVNRYGTKEEEYDFFIYNQPDIVLKVATFWLIRKSNTWKRVKFNTFLNKLNLETFDTVELQFGHVAATSIKAVVENASYDSASNTVQFECLVPVKVGELSQYPFFWPSALPAVDTWPTPAEIAAGNAGGAGIGANATGLLPVGNTSGIPGGNTVFVGGPNVVFRGQSDRGDRTPTDQGFTAQTIIPATVFAEITNVANPNPDLTLNYIDPLPPPLLTQIGAGALVIDIQNTKIVDSNNPGAEAKLASVIPGIWNAALYIGVNSQFGDGSNIAEFDFKLDDSGKYGAGTAFLQE